MSEYLIDTNVLLDVIGADEQFGDCSRVLLEQLAEEGMLIINPVIYAEIGAMCDSLEELDDLLPEMLLRRDPIPWEAHFLAGQAFRRYRRNKGQQKRVLADFLIAAHAAYAGYTLVSRDSGHKRYFNIELLNPAVQAV
jgi:predicted nucleic acid-binding protein